MSCARYADAVLEHALGEPATAELQSHLRECDACRDALERERELVHSIDGELALALHVAPSPALLPRVRARAAAERERRSPAPWRFLVPVAALAATLGIVAWLRPAAPPPHATLVARVEPRRASPAPPSTVIEAPAVSTPAPPPRPVRVAQASAPERLEVLVPQGEEELLRRYATVVRARRVEASPVDAEAARSQELVVPLLPQIAPLEVKSLADVNPEGVDHE